MCYLAHTCGVYYPCDEPLLYKTVDTLSNTCTILYTDLRFNASVTLFLKILFYIYIITISTSKTDLKRILLNIKFINEGNQIYVK